MPPDLSVLEAPIEFKLIRPVCTRSSCELLLRTKSSVLTARLPLLWMIFGYILILCFSRMRSEGVK